MNAPKEIKTRNVKMRLSKKLHDLNEKYLLDLIIVHLKIINSM
jgi:hypothetical protein